MANGTPQELAFKYLVEIEATSDSLREASASMSDLANNTNKYAQVQAQLIKELDKGYSEATKDVTGLSRSLQKGVDWNKAFSKSATSGFSLASKGAKALHSNLKNLEGVTENITSSFANLGNVLRLLVLVLVYLLLLVHFLI